MLDLSEIDTSGNTEIEKTGLCLLYVWKQQDDSFKQYILKLAYNFLNVSACEYEIGMKKNSFKLFVHARYANYRQKSFETELLDFLNN